MDEKVGKIELADGVGDWKTGRLDGGSEEVI
jgi:hypothetical protein